LSENEKTQKPSNIYRQKVGSRLVSQLKNIHKRLKDPENLDISNWAKLKIFGVFKASKNELSLKIDFPDNIGIPIFSGVPAYYSAQKY
jgi:hypothetical protein